MQLMAGILMLPLSKSFNKQRSILRINRILYGNTDNPKEMPGLSDEEREFLDAYANAKKSDKETVKPMLKIIDKMLDNDEERIRLF